MNHACRPASARHACSMPMVVSGWWTSTNWASSADYYKPISPPFAVRAAGNCCARTYPPSPCYPCVRIQTAWPSSSRTVISLPAKHWRHSSSLNNRYLQRPAPSYALAARHGPTYATGNNRHLPGAAPLALTNCQIAASEQTTMPLPRCRPHFKAGHSGGAEIELLEFQWHSLSAIENCLPTYSAVILAWQNTQQTFLLFNKRTCP